MKIVKSLLIILAGVFVFIACQKELSLDSGFAGSVASGSLLDSAGNCKSAAVFGTYYTDSTLTGNNYVVINVNVKTGGSYRIATDTKNGFSFQDSGVVATGMQSIRLKATGKPESSKETTFQVSFDTTFCSFKVTVIGKTPATYALVGSPGTCTNAIVDGTYTAGKALSASNMVTLSVNVTALGSYAVNTTRAGMTFSGTGNFTKLGPQTITLQGSGTPATAGTYTVPVAAGSSNCGFTVTVAAGTGGGGPTDINDADSAWQFTGGPNTFHGPFYDVFDTVYNGAYSLVFLGYTPATGDTTMQLGILFPGGSIKTGTFNTNTPNNTTNPIGAFYFTDYRDSARPAKIYTADNSNLSSNTQITIATFDTSTKIITGTFSGTASNIVNSPAPITAGKFKARVR